MTTTSSLAYLDKPIEHWVRQLKDSNPLIRRLAAHALSMIGPAGRAESVPTLTAALDDPESFVRVWVAAALARVDPTNPQALQALIAAMSDPLNFVRSLGAWHLGRQGPNMPDTTPALPVLQELLKDDDPSVRTEAELALKVIDTHCVRGRA